MLLASNIKLVLLAAAGFAGPLAVMSGLPAKVDGPAALRGALMARKEQFVRTVTGKLLTYAVGREMTYADAPAIRGVVRTAAPDDYRWSSTISAIVKSPPFQMRRSRP